MVPELKGNPNPLTKVISLLENIVINVGKTTLNTITRMTKVIRLANRKPFHVNLYFWYNRSDRQQEQQAYTSCEHLMKVL